MVKVISSSKAPSPSKGSEKASAKTKNGDKGHIKRKIDEEQLEEMLKVVTKRHKLLKKKLSKTKNPKARDRATLRYMFKQSVEMLELANTTFVTSGGKGIYALIALNNNIRELQSDLKTLEDNSEQISFVIDTVIKPLLTIVSQQNLNFTMELKKIIGRKVRSDKAAIIIDQMNDLLKKQAALFDDCLEQATEKVEKFFND